MPAAKNTQLKVIDSAVVVPSAVQVAQTPPVYSFVQVDEFQPNVDGWNQFGNVTSYTLLSDKRSLLLTNAAGMAIKLSFVSPTGLRVRFRPQAQPDYSLYDESYAVVNKQLSPVTLNLSEVDNGGKTLKIDTGIMQVFVGLQPYGIAIYQNDRLITQDTYGKNLIYSNDAVACLRQAPSYENYYGFGEKAGNQLNKKGFTMSFFNYDNFTYAGTNVIPDNNQPGPLNPSEPLYNSIPFVIAVGQSPTLYSYGCFLDNVSQSYFNMGSNDYSNMDGKYYFGALYGELDYYLLIGENSPNYQNNPVRSVLDQFTQLTGRSAMPPMYAFGYQQGCYGYYNKQKLMNVAQAFRDAQIPIDGLHIDVDFQNNYRTFTYSHNKFPDPKSMFDTLHSMGFKCSTNITGIISANPLDENGSRDTPYKARDTFVTISADNQIIVKPGVDVPFIYNTRADQGESPDLFIANESYGQNNGFNPYTYPTPMFPNGQNDLGTYGFYSNMSNPEVQQWWGQQYDDLLQMGMDMIWQDMTDPAIVANGDNNTPDKTLPLDLMTYDRVTSQYQPQAKMHNTFAINLIQATYNGLTALRQSDSYKGTYNYLKRNFIIGRGAYCGVHRYAGVWTGDSASSWDFLSINIPEVLNFGLSGQAISGCDIGGFANGSGSEGGGVTNYELFTRWMTAGAFLPWYRNHYDGYSKSFQEPYNYGEPVPTNCRKYIELRYRLLQLFYDAMYTNTQTGLPVARAIFVNDPFDSNVYQYTDQQFFIGDNLLVAPVTTQADPSIVPAGTVTNHPVYLPAGSQWYVFSDNTQPLSAPTSGGTLQSWYVPLNLVPLYVREGAILPLRELEQYVGQLAVNPITFNIYPGKDSSYQLYQDDHVSVANELNKAYRTTMISHTGISNGQLLRVQRTYDNFTPAEPYYFISLLGTQCPSSVTSSGQQWPNVESPEALQNSSVNSFYYNASITTTFIKVFDTQADISITALF